MTVHELVLATAEETQPRPALIDGGDGREIAYPELAIRIRSVAATLHSRGVGPGDVVALWAPNVPAWAGVAFGTMATGAAVSPIGPLATPREVAAAVATAGARLVLTAPAFADVARSALVACDAEVIPMTPELLAQPPLERLAGDRDAPALLPFSSGTTGPPKAVVLTHGNLLAASGQLRALMGLTSDDVILAAAPFAHVMGSVANLLAPLGAGATVVTLPRFDLEAFLALIERHRVTVTAVPPPLIGALAHDPRVDRFDLSSLAVVAAGGAPLAPAVQRAFQRRLPHVTIGQGYGMTETCAVIAGLDRAGGTRPGTVGRPAPDTEVRIADGELHVRGPQVMTGYLGEPERTSEILDTDGWLRTGDLAELEPDGALRIVGRAKELIKVNGYQVSPAELESVLLEHPAVLDAAVCGVPDERRGEAVVAMVVPGGDLDTGELSQWFSERVAPYKRLSAVHLTETLPRNPAGKLLRRELVPM